MKVSQLLHDGLEAQFSSKPEIVLHSNCRKKYTRPSNIKVAAKSSDKHDAPVPTNSRTRRSLDKVFDFETDCLFCGKDATVGIKLELKYRKQWVIVKHSTFKGRWGHSVWRGWGVG